MNKLNPEAWWPRPFGTYSENKPRTANSSSTGGAGPNTASSTSKAKAPAGGWRLLAGSGRPGMMYENQENERGDEKDICSENTPPDPKFVSGSMLENQVLPPPTSMPSTSAPPPQPSTGRQVDSVRVLLDTWYVIKPGNTQEKIAFFVGHTFDSKGAARPNAMKVKGPSMATDCTRAKRRKLFPSSHDPLTRPQPSSDAKLNDPVLAPGASGVGKPSLLAVEELVSLVEQRTAMCLQDTYVRGRLQQPQTTHSAQQPTLNQEMAAEPTPMVWSESADTMSSGELPFTSPPVHTDQEQQWRVAQAIAHFESQKTLQPSTIDRQDSGNLEREWRRGQGGASESGAGVSVPPLSPVSHSPADVTIAFRVSSLEPRTPLESAGSPQCVFMNCSGGVGQVGSRSKENITGDQYQLVNPSLRDSSFSPVCTSLPKCDVDHHLDSQSCSNPEQPQELSTNDKATDMESMTGFNVDVVVTGALDPPPGQLFFLQAPSKEEGKPLGAGSGPGMCQLDRGNNGCSSPGPGGSVAMGAVGEWLTHDCTLASVGVVEYCTKPSLCQVYQHSLQNFLGIRFRIQRLLGPSQYMTFLPDHIVVKIFSYLPTRSLAALKCTCRNFKQLIETYAVQAVDSRWIQDPYYRDDPCKQCKRQYKEGDVSLCRWHPKPFHHDLPYGRSYWMCCLATEKDTPGCRVGVHDNNWIQTESSQVTRFQREERSFQESRSWCFEEE